MSAEALSNQNGWQSRFDFLWLEITGKCNLACSHCYSNSDSKVPLNQGMGYDDWKQVLTSARDQECRMVQFIGGEPTIHPDFAKLVQHASSIGFDLIEVYTNGTAIGEKTLALFEEHGVHVAVSFYSSTPANHDSITGSAGSQDKTLRAIKRLVDRNIPVRVGITEMGENSDELEETKRLLAETGVTRVSVDGVREVGRGAPELAEADSNPLSTLCGSCWQGQLTVDPQGNVFPCVFSRFAKIGHVSEGFEALLTKAALHAFRSKVRANSEAPANENSPGCKPCNPPVCNPPCNPW